MNASLLESDALSSMEMEAGSPSRPTPPLTTSASPPRLLAASPPLTPIFFPVSDEAERRKINDFRAKYQEYRRGEAFGAKGELTEEAVRTYEVGAPTQLFNRLVAAKVTAFNVGGWLYFAGSIFFFDELLADFPAFGATFFIVGSVLYMLGSMYDLFTAALVLRGFQAAKMARGDVRRRMIKNLASLGAFGNAQQIHNNAGVLRSRTRRVGGGGGGGRPQGYASLGMGEDGGEGGGDNDGSESSDRERPLWMSPVGRRVGVGTSVHSHEVRRARLREVESALATNDESVRELEVDSLSMLEDGFTLDGENTAAATTTPTNASSSSSDTRRRSTLKEKAQHEMTFQSDAGNVRMSTWLAASYVVSCAIGFLGGSCLFLPAIATEITTTVATRIGCWLFIIFSIVFAVTGGLDIWLLRKKAASNREPLPWTLVFVSMLPVIGSLVWVPGSVVLLPEVEGLLPPSTWSNFGPWCFVVGSLCFQISAGISGVNVIREFIALRRETAEREAAEVKWRTRVAVDAAAGLGGRANNRSKSCPDIGNTLGGNDVGGDAVGGTVGGVGLDGSRAGGGESKESNTSLPTDAAAVAAEGRRRQQARQRWEDGCNRNMKQTLMAMFVRDLFNDE